MNKERIINDFKELLKLEKEASKLDPDDYRDFREYLKYRDSKRHKKFNDIINYIHKSKNKLSTVFIRDICGDLLNEILYKSKNIEKDIESEIDFLKNMKSEDWIVVTKFNFRMNFIPIKIQDVFFFDVTYKKDREKFRKHLNLGKTAFSNLIVKKSEDICFASTTIKDIDPNNAKDQGLRRIKEALDILAYIGDTDTKIPDPEDIFAFNQNHVTTQLVRDFIFAGAFWDLAVKKFLKLFRKIYTPNNPMIGQIKRALYFYRRAYSDTDENIQLLFYVISLENLICPYSRLEKKYDFCLRISTILHFKNDSINTILGRIKFLENIYKLRNEIVHQGYIKNMSRILSERQLLKLRKISKIVLDYFMSKSKLKSHKKIISEIKSKKYYKIEEALFKFNNFEKDLKEANVLSPKKIKAISDIKKEFLK
jgi:hypothetical protein